MNRRLAWSALVLAFLCAVAGIGGAEASRLTLVLGQGPAVAGRWSRCASGPVAVTIKGATVTVAGLAATPCGGKTLAVYLRDGSTTRTQTTTISAASATVTFPTAPTDVKGVVVYLGGWPVTTTFEVVPTGPLPSVGCVSRDNPALTCTATITSVNSWGWPTLSDYLMNVTVSTTSTTPVRWQLTFNLSSPDLPFVARKFWDGKSGATVKVSASECSAAPRLVVVDGTTAWGSSHPYVSAGSTRELQMGGTTTSSGGQSHVLIDC